ncbi:MAG: helix-turn-helix domain-containing protein [Betaproteobacteria bacterium]
MNSDAWLLADLLLRFAAAGELALGMAVILRADTRGVGHRVAAGFVACVIAYLVLSAPLAGEIPAAVRVPLVALASVGAAMLWLTAGALFDDSFRLTPGRMVPASLLLVCSLLYYLSKEAYPWQAAAAGNVHKAVAVALYAAAIAYAWRGLRGDLIEARRWFRLWFIGGASILGLAIAVAEVTYREAAVPAGLELAKVGVIFVLTTVLFIWSFELKADWLTAPARPKPSEPQAEEVPPGERQLLAELRQAMDDARVYREEGVTIAALARRLRAPEERLRRVINQRLGYRNFNSFLNERRIADAKAALADPSAARKPVLTIALEAGFGSIGPFNRVFKEAFGETPTEYRRRALSGIDSDPETSPQTGK